MTRADLESGDSGGTCILFFLFMWNWLFQVIQKLPPGIDLELLEHVAFDHAFEVGGRYSRDLYSFWIFGLLMSSGSDKFVVGYRQSSGGLSSVPDLVWIWSSERLLGALWSLPLISLLGSLHKFCATYVRILFCSLVDEHLNFSDALLFLWLPLAAFNLENWDSWIRKRGWWLESSHSRRYCWAWLLFSKTLHLSAYQASVNKILHSSGCLNA